MNFNRFPLSLSHSDLRIKKNKKSWHMKHYILWTIFVCFMQLQQNWWIILQNHTLPLALCMPPRRTCCIIVKNKLFSNIICTIYKFRQISERNLFFFWLVHTRARSCFLLLLLLYYILLWRTFQRTQNILRFCKVFSEAEFLGEKYPTNISAAPISAHIHSFVYMFSICGQEIGKCVHTKYNVKFSIFMRATESF